MTLILGAVKEEMNNVYENTTEKLWTKSNDKWKNICIICQINFFNEASLQISKEYNISQ
jgi:hypothetical protein